MSVDGHKKAERRPVPFNERFRNWWQGVEESMPVEHTATLPFAAPSEPPTPQNLATPLAHWESPAIRASQLLWGDGYAQPGGSDYILDLAKTLALDPTKSLMEFGAGLGGGARAIHRAFGAWVTGFEPDGKIARAGKEMSIIAGLEKKANIMRYDPQGFEPRRSSFDSVLSTETLFQVDRKDDLLGKLEHSLKARGQLVITDFVLTRGVSAEDERLKGFSAKPAFFWSADQYARRFRERSFDLRISEDITAKYRKLVIDRCANVAQGGPALAANAKAYPEAMLALMDLWASRVAAFDLGLLKVMRFSAIKLGSAKLLSDW